MDGMREFLDAVREGGLVAGRLRGLFHIAIGRRITTTAGAVVSSGLTWRELAALLKESRFEKDLVTELGVDPDDLAPRDRQRFWYSAISLAQVEGRQALTEAEQLTALVKPLGYVVSPPPAGPPAPPKPPPPKADKPSAPPKSGAPAKKPKKT